MQDEMGVYSSDRLLVADECRTYGGTMAGDHGTSAAVILAFPGRINGQGPVQTAEVAIPAEYGYVVADNIRETARKAMLG